MKRALLSFKMGGAPLLIALQPYLAEGWQVEILPWVAGVRGLAGNARKCFDTDDPGWSCNRKRKHALVEVYTVTRKKWEEMEATTCGRG